MTTNKLKTEILPKTLIATTLLPVVAIPIFIVALKLPLSLPPSGVPPLMAGVGAFAFLQVGIGMWFNISLALLALAYYGKRPGLAAHRSRFVTAGRAFAGAIAANLLATCGAAAYFFYFPPVTLTVLGDGTVQSTMTTKFNLSFGTKDFAGLAMIVALLLIVDLVDETLRLRDESSLTV